MEKQPQLELPDYSQEYAIWLKKKQEEEDKKKETVIVIDLF